ncbi:DUF6879 family protein [Microlunatus parietis]|uniref:DUF6879 domain-containing protein n=1 Tax=Microlunatus parietis TaxID=682979 RepID=A0A7Y9IC96_9ACTN|nr:DUF6879 family protein [Microlunatus parietis]NYE73956.1 hypothetical protein [Microlunatus parietis]
MISFADVLASTQRSAAHLEMRDAYMLDDPAFVAWQSGQQIDPRQWWPDWLELVRRTVARGVEMRRARIVSEPISDYIRYEYDVTDGNVESGEQVRWLPRRRATDLALPGNDYWIFDDRLVMVNHFAGNGQKSEPGYELIEDAQVVRLCGSAFEAVWERAVPHHEYKPV